MSTSEWPTIDSAKSVKRLGNGRPGGAGEARNSETKRSGRATRRTGSVVLTERWSIDRSAERGGAEVASSVDLPAAPDSGDAVDSGDADGAFDAFGATAGGAGRVGDGLGASVRIGPFGGDEFVPESAERCDGDRRSGMAAAGEATSGTELGVCDGSVDTPTDGARRIT